MSPVPSPLRRLRIGWHSAAEADLPRSSGRPHGAALPADEAARPVHRPALSLPRRVATVAPPLVAVVVAVAVAAAGVVLAMASSVDTATPAPGWRAAPPAPPSLAMPGEPVTATGEPTGTPALPSPSSAGRPATVSSAAGTTPAPPAATGPPSGGKALDISTNYAWARGSVTWNGTTATATGQLHDTPQWTSHSWLRIAYKLLVNGVWTQRYGPPDPYLSAANGEYRTVTWSRGGAVKDVEWDLCSARAGTTYCTGWS